MGRKCIFLDTSQKVKGCVFCFIYSRSSSDKQLSSNDLNFKI